MSSRCGSVVRVMSSDIRGLWFKLANLIMKISTVNCCTGNIKGKRSGEWPIFKSKMDRDSIPFCSDALTLKFKITIFP